MLFLRFTCIQHHHLLDGVLLSSASQSLGCRWSRRILSTATGFANWFIHAQDRNCTRLNSVDLMHMCSYVHVIPLALVQVKCVVRLWAFGMSGSKDLLSEKKGPFTLPGMF